MKVVRKKSIQLSENKDFSSHYPLIMATRVIKAGILLINFTIVAMFQNMRTFVFQLIRLTLVLFLLPACSLINTHKKVHGLQLAADEQCKILGKKRLHIEKRTWRFKNVIRLKYDQVAKNKNQEKSIKTSLSHLVADLTPIEIPDNDTLMIPGFRTQKKINNPVERITWTARNFEMEKINGFKADKSTFEQETYTPGIEGDLIPNLVALGGLLAIVLLSFTQRRSKQVSAWASRNPWASRVIIASIKTSVAFAAFAVGNQLAEQGTTITDSAKYSAMSLFTASVLFYPRNNKDSSYLTRKIHDIAGW